MLLIPAIDLQDGKCVRLRQGDMGQVTRYSDDPVGMGQHWQALGAEFLHVVDLDGAVGGTPKHLSQIENLAHTLSIPIQVGGGIRNIKTVRMYLDSGVDRVVVGTAALREPEFLRQAAAAFPQKILLGLDVKEGLVAVSGWTEISLVTPSQVFAEIRSLPLAGVVFTDIGRDGMLKGPNLSALQEAAQACPVPVIASGGVTSLKDVLAIHRLHRNITGMIIGKALYEGTLDLVEALKWIEAEGGAVSPC